MNIFRQSVVYLGALVVIGALAGCGAAPDEDSSLRTALSSSDEGSGSVDDSNPEPSACRVLEDGTCSGGKGRCCAVEASRFDFEAQCWRPAGPSLRAADAALGYGTLVCMPSREDAPGCRVVGATLCKARMLADAKPEVIRTSFLRVGEGEFLPCEAPDFADFGLDDLPGDVCP